MRVRGLIFLLSGLGLCRGDSSSASCKAGTFADVALPGAKLTKLIATAYHNLSADLPEPTNWKSTNVTGLNVCEVNATYTHPGQGDNITVTVWLPLDKWNSRYMATGGGGYATGHGISDMYIPASRGYVASTTDGGHSIADPSPESWGLTSHKNVNWALLNDFASIALDDMATISKAIAEAFYDSPPKFSYWNGCSTGGRQGYMMAQRYPRQFDGILATAPAINWHRFIIAEWWPQLFMNLHDVYPTPCELDAVRIAATQACDALDGIKDGVLSNPDLCSFDSYTVVGKSFTCTSTGEKVTITKEAAMVAKAMWNGPQSVEGDFQWFGQTRDADLTALGMTAAVQGNSSRREGVPFSIPPDWVKYFIVKDKDYDLTKISHEMYDELLRQSVDQYQSAIGTSNPDLTDFRKAGGKLLSWHGLSDPLIPPNGTFNYYQRALDKDPNLSDYYRLFAAPGIGHCGDGLGWYPGEAVQSLIEWVEKGIAPDRLDAETFAFDSKNTTRRVKLCPYPQKLVYNGGDADIPESFSCEHRSGAFGIQEM